MSNCGLPDGVVHQHTERCYQAGRRDATATVRAAAERASRKGYDLDPDEVLEFLDGTS